MSLSTIAIPTRGFEELGLRLTNTLHYQLSAEELVHDTLRLNQGELNNTGALVVKTGEFTGRSPKDKFIVKDEITANGMHWNEFNLPLDEKYFHCIHKKILDYLNVQPEVWVRDSYACADPRYRLNIRVINDNPWANLFANNMFMRPEEEELEDFHPDWHILAAPGLHLDAAA